MQEEDMNKAIFRREGKAAELKEKLSIMMDSKTPFKELTTVVEEFILVLLASMYLIKRFDFFKLLMENLCIDVDKNPNQIMDLPVSPNF